MPVSHDVVALAQQARGRALLLASRRRELDSAVYRSRRRCRDSRDLMDRPTRIAAPRPPHRRHRAAG